LGRRQRDCPVTGGDDLALEPLPSPHVVRGSHSRASPDDAGEVRRRPKGPLETRRGHVEREPVGIAAEDAGDLLAEAQVDSALAVDVDRQALRPAQLDRKDLDPGQATFDRLGDLAS
jgi:hypothetical protein